MPVARRSATWSLVALRSQWTAAIAGCRHYVSTCSSPKPFATIGHFLKTIGCWPLGLFLKTIGHRHSFFSKNHWPLNILSLLAVFSPSLLSGTKIGRVALAFAASVPKLLPKLSGEWSPPRTVSKCPCCRLPPL